jgi:hypothetical protein
LWAVAASSHSLPQAVKPWRNVVSSSDRFDPADHGRRRDPLFS